MKILFVTSFFPLDSGNKSSFVREYIRSLKKFCSVRTVYLHFKGEKCPVSCENVDFILDVNYKKSFDVFAYCRAKLDFFIKDYNPDLIHCTDSFSYMPFRFDKNVFYSFFGNNLTDLSFQMLKIEKCALENSEIVAVYSKNDAKKAFNISCGLSSPVILPLGFDVEKFLKSENENEFYSRNGKIRVCGFCGSDDGQKSVSDFVFTVNNLGKRFKEKHNIEYSLYGSGKFSKIMNYDLFDNVKIVSGDEEIEAYRNSDIVVLSSRNEIFGISVLKALSFSSVLIVDSCDSLDSLLKSDFNCVERKNEVDGLGKVLHKVVEKFGKMALIRENAVRTAREWTMERCVKSHLYFYEMLMKKRSLQVRNAYKLSVNEVLGIYRNCSDVEKIYRSEMERRACVYIYENFCFKNLKLKKKFLFITGSFLPDAYEIPDFVKTVSVLCENENGVVVRPECLPFENEEFDCVFAIGSWESVINPCSALLEMQRVSKNSVMILSHKGFAHSWQFFKIDLDDDWKKLTSSKWVFESNLEKWADCDGLLGDFKIVRYLKSADVNEVENLA